MNKIFQRIKKLPSLIKENKKTTLTVAAGLAVIAIICVTSLGGSDDGGKKEETVKNDTSSQATELESYSAKLEEQLTQVISSINGVGKVKVMVTLESSAQSVYATSEKRQSKDDENSYDSEYILIKSGSSKEEALLISIIQPQVRGVAVVCQGADDVFVQQRIIDTVSAVLDINTSRISITPMG